MGEVRGEFILSLIFPDESKDAEQQIDVVVPCFHQLSFILLIVILGHECGGVFPQNNHGFERDIHSEANFFHLIKDSEV